MKEIALVSYAERPELTDDDRLLIPAFERLGARAISVAWDGACVDWLEFDHIVLRSCWDYHLRLKEFLKWLQHLEDVGVRLSNSARLVRWNADKKYLKEMQERGARIPPTYWIEEGEERDVGTLLRTHGWETAVAKPTVSASAHGLERVFIDNPATKVIRGPAMVQPFLPEVAIEGEWSLIFLGGKYSHAVLKLPAAGDFRVQWEFGGSATSAEPNPCVLEAANRIIAMLAETPDYARVDGIIHDGEFVLMEIELIEPVLFLGLGGAADRFAEVILNSTRPSV